MATPFVQTQAAGSDARSRAGLVGVGIALLAIAFGFVFFHFLRNQVRFAINLPSDWGHTLIIPLIAGYLVWLNRVHIARVGLRTTWSGLIFVILGIGWYVFCWLGPPAVRHHNTMALGFGVALFGVVLLLAGWRAMRYLLFPLIYLLAFGITISDTLMNVVTYRMQDIAARGSWVMLRVLGFDADLSGNTITLIHGAQEYPLNVAEACSGMRMLVAFVALGTFLAVTRLNLTWQRVALVVLAVPVAIFVNMLRVVTLGLLSTVNSGFAAGDFHSFVGLVWLLPALGLYLAIIWLLHKMVIEERPTISTAPVMHQKGSWLRDRRTATAAFVCFVVVLICGFGFQGAVHALNVHLAKKPIPLRAELGLSIPRELGSWSRVGSDEVLDEATEQALGTRKYLTRGYQNEELKAFIRLHIAYYTDSIDAVPHVAERCFLAGGMVQQGPAEYIPVALDTTMWREESDRLNSRRGVPYQVMTALDQYTRRPYEVRMPVLDVHGEVTLRLIEFMTPEAPDMRVVVAYFFIANGCATAAREDIRKLAFDQTDEYAYYCKVEFSTGGPAATVKADFLASLPELLNSALPEIMRCLPDWAEVERGNVAAAPEHKSEGH
ncbi:MAG: exosortase/archaeosortase family protein [Phycisphaerales bacterium]